MPRPARSHIGRPSARTLGLVGPICAAGLAAVSAAAVSFVASDPSRGTLLSLGVLFAALLLAERYPVPVEGMDAGGVTLGFVFGVATILLLGWQAGVLVAAAAPTLTYAVARRPPLRVAFNGSMFALSALAGGLAVEPLHGSSVGLLAARLVLCAFVYHWVVNLVLVSAALSLDDERPFHRLLATNVRQTSLPFALMASAALTLVVLWQRSPALAVALVGPLVAIVLYQRSTIAALRATRLSLTDTLTGLGNRRHFHERLQRELVRAEGDGCLSLCLVDVDDFKRVNDRFGHPVGDRVLAEVASNLRQGGESFRLGGDEFAVLLPGVDERYAVEIARSIVERVGTMELESIGTITASAGVATYPRPGVGRDELIRLADAALYLAKENGKNCARADDSTTRELGELRSVADSADRIARYRAATSLARAVDARDGYAGSHSVHVGDLAARLARRLGVDERQVELTRLAATLHDVGKLAIPEQILRKPTPLTDAERSMLERHPQIGYRMLETLDADSIADWVLHHHERWDGSGYPDRLAGEQIPLGSRILFVADAFAAMTSERAYAKPVPQREALAELTRCAGTQFDPTLVAAFTDELGGTDTAMRYLTAPV